MEELDKKLMSRDPSVISLLISKLVEHIKEKHNEGMEESAQLSFLQSKCLSDENRINEVAAKGILILLENGIMDYNKIMEDFITIVPNNKISKGVVRTICGILYHQFSKSCDTKYNMFFPQHPLITLLLTNSEYFPLIYKEIRLISSRDKIQSWNMWNYYFYQYCLCNPMNKEPTFYKMRLWTYLITSNYNDELILKLMTWLSFDPTGSMLVSAEMLNEQSFTSSEIIIETEVILLLQMSMLYKLVSNDYDPRDTISAIRLLLTKMDKVDCVNPLLLILARAITRTSFSYALDILEICEILIGQPNVNHFVLLSVRAALLHWIGNPSNLSKDICSRALEINVRLENNFTKELIMNSKNLESYVKYQDIIISNQDLFINFQLATLCELWTNRVSILEFLSSLESVGSHLIVRVIHFIAGLFICDTSDAEITLAAFRILCTYVENFKKYSHSVLTLILYNISNSMNSKIHFKLFKYLPNLTNVSENYQKVVATIKVLFSSYDNTLKTFGMKLMYDLWRIDQNTYPLLEEMLTQEEPTTNIWEYYINKTLIIKQICDINSKLYGEEMVAHLSRILNKCSEGEGELASAIALDAISVLCSEGVIDIKTTWVTLAPKYLTDKRTRTVKSMCGLAGVISNLLHSEHHKELQHEVICKMWDYATKSPDLEVKTAAMDALHEFGLENISPHFPERYLKETTSKTDVLPQLIPGECWIEFLKDQSNLTVAGDFLIKLIRKEVADYAKYVYHITSKREPTDYSLLPTHSLVRGIAEYCSAQAVRWKGLYKHVFIECMRILSQEYSKPLPPYNWCFLQQLFHEPELRFYCIIIASHQVMISGTARRFIENYIDALTRDFKNIEEVTLLYRNLKFLANSIQPTIFEEFFNNTLNYAEDLRIGKKNEQYLISLTDALKDVLLNPSVQDVSKKGIVASIDTRLKSLNETDELFGIYVNCVPCYPTDLLSSITTIPTENMTEQQYRKVLHIRSKLALRSQEKMKWLDDVIDLDPVKTDDDDSWRRYTLREFLNIFKQQKNQSECIRWTVDLIGRIEASIANNCCQSKIIFLIEVLIVSVIAFSGFHIFAGSSFSLENNLNLLPQAANVLLHINEWMSDSSKIIECFYFLNLNKDKLIPLAYQNIFGQALQALRHHIEFKKGNKWMKYLNANVVLKYFE